MSKLNELKKQNRALSISILDSIFLVLSDEKPKYIELFTNLLKNNYENYFKGDLIDIERELDVLGFGSNTLSGFSDLERYIYGRLILSHVGSDNYNDFKKFISLYERNLIEKKDITTIKSFKEISELNSVAEIKSWSKELEGQSLTILDNSDSGWFLIKPLTYESSKKYGASTKWCTTQSNTSEYFHRYYRGILIYCINRITGYKVAAHYDIGESELSFWDSSDRRIDSLMTQLDSECFKVIRDEIKKGLSNRDLTPEIYKLEEYEDKVKVFDTLIEVIPRDRNAVEGTQTRTIPIFDFPENPGNVLTMDEWVSDIAGEAPQPDFN